MAQTKGKEAFCHCVDLQAITFRETAAPVVYVCALCAIGSNRNAQAGRASTQSVSQVAIGAGGLRARQAKAEVKVSEEPPSLYLELS
jgi:hypothetical protein